MATGVELHQSFILDFSVWMSPFGSATCKLIFREAHKNPAFGGVFLRDTFDLAAGRRPDPYPERDEPALTPL